MTCPNCKCQKCRDASKAAMKAVLRSHVVPRETETPEQHNAAALQLSADQSAWRDVDPAADQLARDVVRDMGRGDA